MTTQTLEHPSVDLYLDQVLTPAEIAAVTAANATTKPEQSYREALLAYRLFAIRHAKDTLKNATIVNDTVIRTAMDLAWQAFSPVFKKATGPMIAEAYIQAFRNVEEGTVPIQLIYDLADQHAERVGKYFNETSSDALVQGFNTYVNRKVPQRAAIERVIDAYGMTPRQMNGFVSATALQPQEIKTGIAQNLKRRVRRYIGKSISARLDVFQGQEAHNLDEQAKQVAWMWLVQNNKISAAAQKMWLTAKDERVCEICGPMHGRKVDVKDKFVLQSGLELYVPGAHVNCRCTTRLQINPFEVVTKADDDFDPRQHPRGGNPRNRGQFSRRSAARPYKDPRPVDPELQRLQEAVRAGQVEETRQAEHVDLSAPAEDKIDLGTVDLSAKKVDLGRVDLSTGINLSTSESVDLSTAVEEILARRTVDLTAAQETQLSMAIRENLESLGTKRQKTKVRFRNSVPFPDTGYAFVKWEQVLSGTEQVVITDQDDFKIMSKAQADDRLFASALEVFSQRQREVVQNLVSHSKEGDFALISRNDPRLGKRVFAEISADQIVSAIDAASNPQSFFAHGNLIPLSWTDRSGNLVWDEDDEQGMLTPSQLAKLLNISREDVEVVVVKADEGYEDTVEWDVGSNTQQPIYRAPGTYKIVGEKPGNLAPTWYGSPEMYSDINIPIRYINIEPEVKEVTYTRDYDPETDD